MSAKIYSKKEIEILSNNPCVKHVKKNRLSLTYEFRLQLYEEWIKMPSLSTIRRVMKENGIDPYIVGFQHVSDIAKIFKRHGRPSGAKNEKFGVSSRIKINKNYDNYLISTGLFQKSRNGISFSNDFIQCIYDDYPEISIEEQLISKGLNPEKIGYRRIYNLKKVLDGNSSKPKKSIQNESFVTKYQAHPYVARCSVKQFTLKAQFYNEATIFKSMRIHDILKIFEINSDDLDISLKSRIKYKLDHWKPKNIVEIDIKDEMILKIERNKYDAYQQLISDMFTYIKSNWKQISGTDKKALVLWVQQFPYDNHQFTIRSVLKQIGLSKTHYYSVLINPNYGEYEIRKAKQDNKDIKIIKQVIDSEIYPMGHRMVYMKMKSITGIQFGKKKILRLMRKAKLNPTVRKAKKSRIENRKMIAEHVKPNHLKRTFRLHLPYEVVLTDVSYLNYGMNQRAYLSALKDSVTGRIYCLNVSDSNDMGLVENTITHLNKFKFNKNAIFHSDQGILYLSDSFQNKINELGFKQSMSRRGNCWDNASQESFFGHFKDECKELIRQCDTLDEVKLVINDYMQYYNERRPQWTRNQMTPIEFEAYLVAMNNKEFEQYLAKERVKYDKMIKEASEKAKVRAKDIGLFGG